MKYDVVEILPEHPIFKEQIGKTEHILATLASYESANELVCRLRFSEPHRELMITKRIKNR